MSYGRRIRDWARHFGISEHDVEVYLDTFQMLDENKDGLITAAELHNALKLLGCHTTIDQAIRMVQAADQNGDGMVDVTEYLSMIIRSPTCLRPDVEAESWMTFKMFDRNRDGYISLDDLRDTMAKLGQTLTNEEARAILHTMDTNKDGLISYSEFIASWTDWLLFTEKSP